MTYKICSRCIMDTSDPEISFNQSGVCNHCQKFDVSISKHWWPNEKGKALWSEVVDKIKDSGKKQEYDCILGLSGGVDSSYLALKIKDWGLRPLVVHVDAGWNSELAVANIERIVKHCNYDLHTHVVDWEEMRDLHLAYLKAGVANQDVPQDHIFFSTIYHYATRHGIRYILSGGNIATEGIFPDSWHGSAMDAINLRAIHKKYGKNPLRNYETISFFEYYLWYPLVKKMATVRPLNYMPYIKSEALTYLQEVVDYKPYPRKHGESLFTKFFQNYYLPEKFGYDKRRPHLSSLVVSGQLSREEALHAMEEPLYDPHELELDKAYFCKKLRINQEELEQYMKAPSHHFSEFPTWESRYRLLKKAQRIVERILGKKVGIYS